MLPARGRLGIRWPNDIESDDRKLGGLLPELFGQPGRPRILIGVGLNITTDLASLPEDVQRMATSLAAVAGEPLDRRAIYRAILPRIEPTLAALARNDPVLSARWEALDTLRDQPIRLRQGETILSGIACGISPLGSLCVRDGREFHECWGGEVLREDISS